jgi:hypothetical protein
LFPTVTNTASLAAAAAIVLDKRDQKDRGRAERERGREGMLVNEQRKKKKCFRKKKKIAQQLDLFYIQLALECLPGELHSHRHDERGG